VCSEETTHTHTTISLGSMLLTAAVSTMRHIIPFPDVHPWIMPKRLQLERLQLEEHLGAQELVERYRKAHDPVERPHYQIVWLLAQGKLTREVAHATGDSPEWIRELSRRYNERGAEGLGDRKYVAPQM
jgi:hypothetical protein